MPIKEMTSNNGCKELVLDQMTDDISNISREFQVTMNFSIHRAFISKLETVLLLKTEREEKVEGRCKNFSKYFS
ncbi:hypothetical protein AC625_19440 [Peribacillus loiseleuriae]|uniref:Uncharacterized protein n=1 Tax=Peribacillus loiseleuriae TaxID=1679170 RepID=A0A0K9GXT3_9BACI|nr:hypothetical protein AC625_19440 [Peribacillus loiseleuriae]